MTPLVLNQVVAFDDWFYVGGEFKRVDFSCNTQFGSYCAQALLDGSKDVGGAQIRFHDVGAEHRSLAQLLEAADGDDTHLLVLIPCGRYREATYSTIARLVERVRPRLCLLAGACLPDDPARILDRIPLVDGILLGDDPTPLADVAAAITRPAWRSTVTDIAGFAWRCHDGSIVLRQSRRPVGPLGPLSLDVRGAGLQITRDRGAAHVDSYGKWLIDSSVGCPRKCIYCRTPVLSRRQNDWTWRPRTAADMADELEKVVRAYGITEFRFQDDNFLMPDAAAWQRCHEFVDELDRRNLNISFQIMFHVSALTNSDPQVATAAFESLERVGLERVFLGTESGDDATLRYYRKESTLSMNEAALRWLAGRAVVVVMGAVVFHPRTTIAQLRNDHAFFRRWIGSSRFAALAPLGTYTHIIPGSELEDEVISTGLQDTTEAEFRPADDSAAAALRAMIRFRRRLFAHDWYLFAVRRDLRHWLRVNRPDPETEALLDATIRPSALTGLDHSIEIIDQAANGGDPSELERNAALHLYQLDFELSKVIEQTPFSSSMRARLYSEPQ